MNLIPCDPKLEESVLGSCLIDPGAIVKVMSIVEPGDFHIEKNRWVYEAMESIQRRGDPLDVVTLRAEIEKRGKTKDIGGDARIISLMNAEGSAINVESYANRLVDIAGKRRIYFASLEIVQFSVDGMDYEETHDKAIRELLKVAPKKRVGPMSSESSVGDLLIKTRMRVAEPVQFSGTRTGYIDWDKTFGGLQEGLHVIVGRTSSGKTWLSLGIAEGVAKQGIPVAFISLEMSRDQINRRRVSRFSGLRQVQLMTGAIYDLGKYRKFNKEEVDRMERGHEMAMANPIWIESEHFATSSRVIATINRLKAEHGIGLAVVDYIQKFIDRAEREEKALGDAAHNLKDCADQLGIPIVTLSQVNRSNNLREDRFLKIGDVRGSGQVEEAADTVYSISSEDYGKHDVNYKRKNTVDIECLKDRLGGGAGKTIHLAVVENIGSIENLEQKGEW